mmetsp:Transcript_126618/g.369979  ORF Transcript_126618/g.369979 Transcript_126618/m.369979 type:complete len:293 (+) Transcript_126618:55-933(+)
MRLVAKWLPLTWIAQAYVASGIFHHKVGNGTYPRQSNDHGLSLVASEEPAGTAPVESERSFVPVALARSPQEFVRLSLDHAGYAFQRIRHPVTWRERYRQSPFRKVQDVTQARIWKQIAIRAAISCGIFSTLSFLTVIFRDPRKMPLEPRQDSDRDPRAEWDVGPMRIMEDMEISVWAGWCPGIRWAQTAEQTGFMRFWPAFCIMTFLWTIKWIYFWICTWFMLFDLTGLVLICHRRRMRQRLELPSGLLTWGEDCCLSFFCAFNVIAHEARVAKAMLLQAEPKDGKSSSIK